MSEIYTKQQNVGYTSDMITVIASRTRGGTYLSYTATPTRVSVKSLNTLSGFKNPKWRDQVRNALPATTHCDGVAYTFDPVFLTAGYSYYSSSTPNVETVGEWFGHHSMNLPVLQATPAAIITEIHNRCIRKFISACEATRSSVEAGQDFGEWKQTIESIIRPMSSARKTITDHYERLTKASRRYRAWDVPSRKKALADSYLEWTFGFKPLAIDIAQGYEGLKKRFNRMTNIVTVSAGATGTHTGSNQTFNVSGQSLNVQGTKKSVSKYQERMKGGYRVGLQPDGSLLPVDVLQIRTLDDFKITAWDLLPYSFLIDYFTNIGDIIHASTAVSANVVWGNSTVRRQTIDTYQWKVIPDFLHNPSITYTENYCKSGDSIASATSFTRDALTPAQLIPEFRFSIPTSAKPWLNMLALVVSPAERLVPYFRKLRSVETD
jgi:hypothetical protein